MACRTGWFVLEKMDAVEDDLQAADVGLFTSEVESFCLSILEGMFFACPSVSTSVGGIPEVVEHNKTGILVPSGDSEALAREVEGLIKNDEPAARPWSSCSAARTHALRCPDSHCAQVRITVSAGPSHPMLAGTSLSPLRPVDGKCRNHKTRRHPHGRQRHCDFRPEYQRSMTPTSLGIFPSLPFGNVPG